MKKSIFIAIFSTAILILLTVPTFAADVGPESMRDLYETIDKSLDNWLLRIIPYILRLLYFMSLIAFAIGCKDLILSGGGLQLEGIVALIVRLAFLVGLITWLMNFPKTLLFIPESLRDLGLSIGGQKVAFNEVRMSFNGMTKPITDYAREFIKPQEVGMILCWFLVVCIRFLSVLIVVTVLIVQIETMLIFIGGMITAAFFVIGYFRDLFMGYIKALVLNGLKLLLLSLCLGIMTRIIKSWTPILEKAMENLNGIYDTAIPMVACLFGFYVIIRTVPQFAITILTGQSSTGNGFAKSALMTGLATGAAIWNVSRGVSQTALNTASTVHEASQAFKKHSPVK
jgi:P-type conjugative transfer protein TrbL